MFKTIQARNGFASDNSSGVHPSVLSALNEVNKGHVFAYGNDPYTEIVHKLFKQQFGEQTNAYFVFLGTGANIISIRAALKPFEAVVCSQCAHINEHECGAPEYLAGCKLIDIATSDGKLTVASIQKTMQGLGDEHYVQPKLISITQVTETGLVYSLDELKALTRFAKENNLYVHLDGARIANAAAALNLPFKAFTTDIGIDIVSFGGTKNGLMYAEAVVVLNPALANQMKFLRKQSMQLASKMRFIAAQFAAYFSDDLWLENAKHANAMANYFAQQLKKLPNIKLNHSVDANIIFANLSTTMITTLQKEFDFYVVDAATSLVRLVTSFNTQKDDIDAFIEIAASC